MKSPKFLQIFVTLFLIITFSKSEEEHFDPDSIKTCGDAIAYLVKKQLGNVKGCVEDLGLKSGKERAMATNCIMKCVLKREGMLDKDGQPDIYTITQFVINEIPDFLQNRTLAVLEACRNVGVNLDDKEKTCKTYHPIITCMLENVPNMCGDSF